MSSELIKPMPVVKRTPTIKAKAGFFRSMSISLKSTISYYPILPLDLEDQAKLNEMCDATVYFCAIKSAETESTIWEGALVSSPITGYITITKECLDMEARARGEIAWVPDPEEPSYSTFAFQGFEIPVKLPGYFVFFRKPIGVYRLQAKTKTGTVISEAVVGITGYM